ncbi:MAG: hypothetical protein IJO11_01270, partial [Alphaproteobacteria bacterium]|nr:hypothetical protein [Alphaproteobacteria bacterium]
STCPDSTPICHSTLQKCVSCESNEDCNKNQICSEYNEETGEKQVCITVTEKCAEGEFRSKNGACIPCDYSANVLINSDETFMEDMGTGKELCLACPNSRRVEGKGDKMYCSKYCTNGFSFSDTTTTCQMCTNEKGVWNRIDSSENNRKCLDCSEDHYYFTIHNAGSIWKLCANITSCANDEYFFPTRTKSCHKCDYSSGTIFGFTYFGFTANKSIPDRKTSCESCPNTSTSKRWWVQYGANSGYMSCFPVCEQPNDGSDSCENKTPETCNRKFQGTDAKCYACNEANKVHIGHDSGLHKLCTDCKRQISGEYCVLKETCTSNQFQGMDGKCYDCSETKAIRVVDETESKCAANCATYKNGNYTGREILNGYSSASWVASVNICRLKCNEKDTEGNKLFQSISGGCVRCDDENDIGMSSTNLTDIGSFIMKKAEYNDIECHLCVSTDNQGNEIKMRESYSDSCRLLTSCDDGFKDAQGNCLPCNTPETKSGVLETECNKCSTERIWMGTSGVNTTSSCVFIKSGEKGVCNNIGNGNFPSHDDSARKMLRDASGNCHYCDTSTQVNVGQGSSNRSTSQQQCAHCGTRNYSGDYCNPGLCSDGITFINIQYQCVQCDTTTVKTEIPLGIATENSCQSCDSKRVMKTGSTSDNNLRAYCVQECAPGGFQKTDGKCYFSSSDYGAIGSDEQSKRLCWDSGRVAFTKLSTSDITEWYCSQTATETEHFINIAGQRISCTADDTEIPDSQDARNLCTKCANRSIETVNEKIM